MDMDTDVMAKYSYGKAALRKLAPVSENFRLFLGGWIGKRPEDFKEMRVTGAEFRAAKTGKNAGKLSIMVKGTKRSVIVTKGEMRAFDESAWIKE